MASVLSLRYSRWTYVSRLLLGFPSKQIKFSEWEEHAKEEFAWSKHYCRYYSTSSVCHQSTGETEKECTTLPAIFRYTELQMSLVPPEKKLPIPNGSSSLTFGKSFTDHMLEVEWDEGTGWGPPKISPFHNLELHPASKVFHYAIQLYEGMKAYRGVDERIRLFRPDLNMKRMLHGSQRALLPLFDPKEFLKCVQKLVLIDQEWIPPAPGPELGPGPESDIGSLYIRPTFIGTEPTISIGKTSRAILYAILSPVGQYYQTGRKSVSLLADSKYVRAWPGGCGDTKLGSNYAPTLFVQKYAEERGHSQVLWLYGDDYTITEAGSMNIFVVIRNASGEKELITPALNGLILPGITRQSVLEMTREWAEFKVTERTINMGELLQLHAEKRLLEMFGVGTACLVCPVRQVSFLGKELEIPTAEQDHPIHARILKSFSDIYYGRVDHKWSVILDDPSLMDDPFLREFS